MASACSPERRCAAWPTFGQIWATTTERVPNSTQSGPVSPTCLRFRSMFGQFGSIFCLYFASLVEFGPSSANFGSNWVVVFALRSNSARSRRESGHILFDSGRASAKLGLISIRKFDSGGNSDTCPEAPEVSVEWSSGNHEISGPWEWQSDVCLVAPWDRCSSKSKARDPISLFPRA